MSDLTRDIRLVHGGTRVALTEIMIAVTVSKVVRDAMWRGDQDLLHRIARCTCCCDEHTSDSCPARAWHGCLGSGSDPGISALEVERWAAHYGMTVDRFLGTDSGAAS
jgi:hypothetical protein